MFHKPNLDLVDLSADLRDLQDWHAGTLRSFEYPLDTTTLAAEPASGLLAIGTASGGIFLFGRSGVECKLIVPQRLGVKFLQFAPYVFHIVCIDDNDQLHVWDLSNHGRPKYLITAKYDHANCLTISPSHSHAFIALQSGEIRTYDLTCYRKSSYTIPSLWTLYEEKIAASSLHEISDPTARIPVDVVVHPRDLNLLFIVYGGGIILSDLTQRNTLRAYELVLPPGAPGGSGYGSPNLLSHRRPSVTTFAVHPAGHFFAAGYSDGSVAFWAVEDEDQPLLVITLDDVDVNLVDGNILEKYFPHDDHAEKEPIPAPSNREPIFRLSWSGFPNSTDPRGGETSLTILGGLPMEGTTGISVHWLPAFNPAEPPTLNPASQIRLHPVMRNAMRDSLTPLKEFFYPTPGTAQDFLLLPRDSPHFGGTFDPTSILILFDGHGGTRAMEAYQFPPPTFLAVPLAETMQSDSDDIVEDLTSTLNEMQMEADPRRLRLPTALEVGSSGLISGQLLRLDREVYETLITNEITDNDALPLKGGIAWADESKSNELKLSKYQPHRILVTFYRDVSVQFHDISAQLLINLRPIPLDKDFPNPLPELIIELGPVLIDPAVTKNASPTFLTQTRIESVQLASESLECSVAFRSGELVVFRLQTSVTSYKEISDKELVSLQHVEPAPGRRFRPYFLLTSGKGPLTASAISDAGFLAAAYADGSLLVVDMRGPRITFRLNQDNKRRNRHSLLHMHSDIPDYVSSLAWTVSTLASDPQLRVRLIAVRESGLTQVFTLSRPVGSGSWTVDGNPTETDGVVSPFAQGNFVLDSKSGFYWKADGSRLAASLQPTPAGVHGIWIIAGAKGVRCMADITGDRIGKADWGTKVGAVQNVQIVEKSGAHSLVAFTDRHEALVYSLPHLELMHIVQLPPILTSQLSADDTGDLMLWTRHPPSGTMNQATYATLFDSRRAYTLPDIELTKPTIPPQPQPVSVGPTSLLSSWFRFGQSMTGDQLDELLGGPNRPIPEPPIPRGAANQGSSMGNIGKTAAELAKTAAGVQSNLYDRLSSALNERGQMLGDLEDRFNSLEEGSKGMVAEAKRLATQQTAKTTAKGWLGF